ncbi:MAG: sodium ion-translocating decarboxylase subunit beta [Desulfurococcales archaeon]|nr:sodium ion-translocating decarboxylase subunit beta [Desulfurococcales archaeon]
MDPLIAAFQNFLLSTGIAGLTPLHLVFLAIGSIFLYLGLYKRVEPLLLIGLGVGIILANIPGTHLAVGDGFLALIRVHLIENELVPLFIFLGLGALTDFRPLIAQPYTLLLGAAAQLGVFITLLGTLAMGFHLNESAAIAIIGGADGPTTVYTCATLAPYLLGPVALAAYTYMSMVPIIQPPIIRLIPKRHRMIKMRPPRKVTDQEALLFPIVLLSVTALLVPASTPLIGMLALGNIFRESRISEVVERLAKTSATQMMDVLIILLTLGVGSTLSVDYIDMMAPKVHLTPIKFLFAFGMIFIWGLFAFGVSTLGGVLLGEVMYFLTGGKVNPAIGAAGVSAVPMSARVVQREVQRVDPSNYIIMNAMGPNVAGVIGTATVAGIYIGYVKAWYIAKLGFLPWK